VPEILKNRDNVKEMFIYTESLKIECMQSLSMRVQSGYPFDFALESMMQYTFMSDKFFLKYGIEEDDLFQAVKDLGIQKDPDVV